MVTVAEIQQVVDNALADLSKTTMSYAQLEKKYGKDWTKWPHTSNWYKALSNLIQIRKDVTNCAYSDYGISSYNS